jgi:hypothetical protein
MWNNFLIYFNIKNIEADNLNKEEARTDEGNKAF